ncbi:DEAD/DEAH box helicase family protein [Mycobacterium xenopi 3993]|nr:DEAD/DEAH box helicase family protein [Mycobacterium xenopi 3993]
MDAFERLHPGLQYHLANTLRWTGLRPTQAQAVAPILDGRDTLVLAPTAGGKTEAAVFPLLSRMATEDWQGLSVLYVCPLRALLNNLQPRIDGYARWLGRSAAVWHGDVGQSQRRRILAERPDVLLTTPESIESMLVSTKVDPRVLFSGLRAVVVDEIHAFAGDDRAGTCSRCWSGCRGWPAASCSGWGCRRPSETRRNCWPGCRAASSHGRRRWWHPPTGPLPSPRSRWITLRRWVMPPR